MNVVGTLITVVTLRSASSQLLVQLGSGGNVCVLKNEAIKCWGENRNGQLGLATGSYDDLTVPPDDPIELGNFTPVDLGCGYAHCCAIGRVSGTDSENDAKSVKCWGSSYFSGQLGLGNVYHGTHVGTMGDNLPLVQLPTGFEPASIVVIYASTCVLSVDGDIVCWGNNGGGELMRGDTEAKIGSSLSDMGDNLVFADLGDFEPIALYGHLSGFCALSTEGGVKCWGQNWYGDLGLGDRNHRGDQSDEVGNNLPIVDLGTGFVVDRMSCGNYHCCVLSTNNIFKCFGGGSSGQLGFEDNINRGDGDEEMGDYLQSPDLGFEIKEFECIGLRTCAISTEGELQCWGANYRGALGIGHTYDYRYATDVKGYGTEVIDIGSGFDTSEMYFATGNGEQFACVYQESTELLMKCWGYNWGGQLGIGDTDTRGDSGGEMGNALPFIDLKSWPIVETTAPTTAQPTSAPTVPPTVCDESSLSIVNWHDLMNSGERDASLMSRSSISFEGSALSLTFEASLKYVGQSADGSFDDDFNLGTTYWMDFQSFSTVDGGVDSAGSCGNRRSADYTDLSFDNFWKYPVNPGDLDEMETAERMAYPPSDWNLEAINCTVIEYERTLSWTELTACSDADGDALIEITETDDAVLLEGTFFVELVSPYSMSSGEYYRTFPLLQQEFRIALNREVNALASTGVQLFVPSVMAYGRDNEGNYEVTVLVQSADYVMLGMDEASIASISSPLAVTGFETVNADCLVASSFTCGQIFTATIPASCPDEDSVIDLSGTYQFGFTPQCRDIDGSTDPACDVFMTTLDDAGKVVLEVDASFIDQCDVDLFEVTFDGDLSFFADDEFSVAVHDGSDPFVIGQDTIYGKVTVDIPDDASGAMYDFVSVSIENVYVCTAEDELSVDDESGLGGCLSSDIVDDDGPYTVIGSGAVADYQGTTDFDVAANNEAAFSFLTFDTARTTINVHVQLLLTLTTESGEVRRRRMLLQSGSDGEDENGNAFRSYIGTASVAEEETTADPVGTDGGFARFSFGFIPAMWVVVIAFIMG